MKRLTVQLADSAKTDVEASATNLDMTVPDYIRRSLALTLIIDRYIHDDTLTVVKYKVVDGKEIEEQTRIVTSIT